MADVRGYVTGAPPLSAFTGITTPTPCSPFVYDQATGDIYVVINGNVVKASAFATGWVTPLQFGAKWNGSDDTAAWQAAHDALPSQGGVIFAPVGTSGIGSVSFTKQVRVIGSGNFTGGTLITPLSANSNVFHLNGSSISFDNLCIDPFAVAQTGGSFFFLDASASIIDIGNVRMIGWWNAIDCNGVSDINFHHLRLDTGVPSNGVGISISNGIAVRLWDIIETNAQGSEPAAGLVVTNCGDVSGFNCQFVHNKIGCLLEPGASQNVTSFYMFKLFCDNNSDVGMAIAPSSTTGNVHRWTLVNPWLSSSGNGGTGGRNGLLVDTHTVAGTVNGGTILAPEAYGNGTSGMSFVGANTQNITIYGGGSAGNGIAATADGISVDLGAHDISIEEVTCGPYGEFGANSGYGINLVSGTGADYILLDGNDVRGNTTGTLRIGSTGTGRRIVNNAGYNPVGTVAISVTASPFTHTAGDTPESIMINGGTVSLVTVNGGNSFSQTNCTVSLAPGQAVVVTYTVAPTMTKQVD